MKRILSFLMSSTLVITSTSQIIACTNPLNSENSKSNIDYLNIGKDIDTKYAYNDGVNSEEHEGFTNYYIIGDSLSDMDGLTTFFSDYLGETGKTKQSSNKIKEFNLKFKGGYGFDENEKRRNPFTNGEPAGYVIAKELHFDNLEASNYYKKIDLDIKTDYGNNYAVGGATAAKFDSPTSKLLFNNFIIVEQTKALIEQHKIGANDFTLFQIGPNDLFAINEMTDDKDIDKSIQDVMDAITYSFFSLLNNGVKNVLFMTPPTLDTIPLYNSYSEEQINKIKEIGEKFNTNLIKVINLVMKFYPENVQYYDLYKDFENVKREYKDSDLNTSENSNKLILDKGYSKEKQLLLTTPDKKQNGQDYKFEINSFDVNDLTEFLQEVSKISEELKGKSIDINGTMTMAYNSENGDENIENYFFVDDVHPSKGVHKYVAMKKILPIIKDKFIKKS
ncbi:SGNH/GDSL hydrolase family protein [Spiroplasma taiwanense]|uniref:Lysophospholipase n=1 Tax=Spiroplasma taiwanense CT-1 TaxID=1276220 RepID=S5MBA7_9MOLU|nr:SGNH/GDSL hydrolase family protein [Spiroplasma taiwanense]AGR41053.1 lysophospholipase [Spiroplasma taiwanense CT-1]